MIYLLNKIFSFSSNSWFIPSCYNLNKTVIMIYNTLKMMILQTIILKIISHIKKNSPLILFYSFITYLTIIFTYLQIYDDYFAL